MNFDAEVLKKGALVAAVVIVVAVGLYLWSSMPAAPPPPVITGGSTTINVSQNGTTNVAAGVKLSETPYAAFANLVYSPVNNSVQYEAAGFSITRTNLTNGSVQIRIAALGALGTNSTFTFPKNDSLYYVDSSIGDDNPPSSEYSLSDDHVVLVDPQGYIVNPVMSP